MRIFNEETKKELKEMIGELPNEVNIAFFTSKTKCRSCRDTLMYIEEFSQINDKIKLSVYDINEDIEMSEKYTIERVPAMVVLDKDLKNRGIKFYGIPSGYEVHSLIASVRESAGIVMPIDAPVKKRIKAIDKEVKIKVFVTPTCPYCPQAVITGHRLAYLNDNIECEMIEAGTYPQESVKYGVRGVPKIVVNETNDVSGSQPLDKILEVIENLEE